MLPSAAYAAAVMEGVNFAKRVAEEGERETEADELGITDKARADKLRQARCVGVVVSGRAGGRAGYRVCELVCLCARVCESAAGCVGVDVNVCARAGCAPPSCWSSPHCLGSRPPSTPRHRRYGLRDDDRGGGDSARAGKGKKRAGGGGGSRPGSASSLRERSRSPKRIGAALTGTCSRGCPESALLQVLGEHACHPSRDVLREAGGLPLTLSHTLKRVRRSGC